MKIKMSIPIVVELPDPPRERASKPRGQEKPPQRWLTSTIPTAGAQQVRVTRDIKALLDELRETYDVTNTEAASLLMRWAVDHGGLDELLATWSTGKEVVPMG